MTPPDEDGLFIEVDFAQARKRGENICGDAFVSQKFPEERRVISVLSDGLGSGVKANILASMTAEMAVRFVASNMDILRSAEIMMEALPVCQVRKISYATFTIIDTHAHGETRVIEMDNPPFLHIRRGVALHVHSKEMVTPKQPDRRLRVSQLDVRPGDRIVAVSDGITQAGIGDPRSPLGWRDEGLRRFVLDKVQEDKEISARKLAASLLKAAVTMEPNREPLDDMTCSVIYFRRPRRLLVLTGPPYAKERDAEYAHRLDTFPGKRVICGGTTANIVARELGRDVEMNLRDGTDELPPTSNMEGADLVTEGMLTLTHAARILENDRSTGGRDPAARLANLLVESDAIDFVVGTRINEAHQDPRLPLDIEIRRNIVNRIATTLREKYLKDVTVDCV